MNKEDKHQSKNHTQGAHKGHHKVFDVVPPGRAPASATSRPVIMGHKPPVPDDQFVAASKTTLPDNSGHITEDNAKASETSARASNPADRHTLLNPKHKVEITPSHVDFEVGSVATDADVQQPVEKQSNAETPPPPDIGRIESTQIAAPTSTSSSNDVGVATETETPTDKSTPAFAITDPANGMSSPTPADADSVEVDSAPPASFTTTTSTVLQNLNAEEAKNTSVAPSQHHSSKTIDELLAETGAPDLGPTNEPPQKTIISHHQPHQSHLARNVIVTLIVVIVLAVVVADILLDGGFITTKLNIPHTHFF